jgi:23S rRNA (guanosine2251-2'-O)-methyltransferase
VREALRARRRRIHRLLIGAADPADVERVVALAAAASVPVERLEPETIRTLPGSAGERSQGLLLDADPLPDEPLDRVWAGTRGARLVVALDGIEDPQNVGAVARVAEGVGAGGLVLPERRAAPLSPAASRASAGALEWLPVARVVNLSRALESLKAEGFWVLGTAAEAEADLYSLPDRVVEGDLVVVLGAEGRGIRPGIERQLDHCARIPTSGRIASLNVATAAAATLFELARRRRGLATVGGGG